MLITETGMWAFRCAATLVDVLPRARIEVRDGERTLLTVSRRHPDHPAGGPVVPPCRFRAAVADAQQFQRQGLAFQLLGLPALVDPNIRVGLPAGDAVHPGGIYQVLGSNDRYLFLFMTSLDIETGQRAIGDAMIATDRPSPPCEPVGVSARRIGFHHDPLTRLTVVHVLVPASEAEPATRLMNRLLEVCTAAEAIAGLPDVDNSHDRQ